MRSPSELFRKAYNHGSSKRFECVGGKLNIESGFGVILGQSGKVLERRTSTGAAQAQAGEPLAIPAILFRSLSEDRTALLA